MDLVGAALAVGLVLPPLVVSPVNIIMDRG